MRVAQSTAPAKGVEKYLTSLPEPIQFAIAAFIAVGTFVGFLLWMRSKIREDYKEIIQNLKDDRDRQKDSAEGFRAQLEQQREHHASEFEGLNDRMQTTRDQLAEAEQAQAVLRADLDEAKSTIELLDAEINKLSDLEEPHHLVLVALSYDDERGRHVRNVEEFWRQIQTRWGDGAFAITQGSEAQFALEVILRRLEKDRLVRFVPEVDQRVQRLSYVELVDAGRDYVHTHALQRRYQRNVIVTSKLILDGMKAAEETERDGGE